MPFKSSARLLQHGLWEGAPVLETTKVRGFAQIEDDVQKVMYIRMCYVCMNARPYVGRSQGKSQVTTEERQSSREKTKNDMIFWAKQTRVPSDSCCSPSLPLPLPPDMQRPCTLPVHVPNTCTTPRSSLTALLCFFPHLFLLLEVLVEDDIVDLAADVGAGDKVTQETSLGVTLDEDDAAVALLDDGNEVGGVIEGEVAGEAAAGGDLLELGEGTSSGVDGEVDEGVGDDGLVGGVLEAGDLPDGLVAGGGEKEGLVGLCVEIG